MRKLGTGLLVLGMAFGASSAAFAQGYGMAGCGLGSLVFGNDNSMVKQILAATTNGTFGSQTFGITTGTSNCTPGGGAGGVAVFVEANREALAKDISRGSGETLVSLTSISGCTDSKKVATKLQSSFGKIFPNAGVSDAQVSSNIVNVLQSDASLSCKSLL